MRVADRAHDAEDVIPRLLLGHDRVWKHAAVPTNVIEPALQAAGVVAQPEPGVPDDVEPAVRIVWKAVPPGLVVRTGSLHGSVVFRDVKVDGARPERPRHLLQPGVEGYGGRAVQV